MQSTLKDCEFDLTIHFHLLSFPTHLRLFSTADGSARVQDRSIVCGSQFRLKLDIGKNFHGIRQRVRLLELVEMLMKVWIRAVLMLLLLLLVILALVRNLRVTKKFCRVPFLVQHGKIVHAVCVPHLGSASTAELPSILQMWK